MKRHGRTVAACVFAPRPVMAESAQYLCAPRIALGWTLVGIVLGFAAVNTALMWLFPGSDGWEEFESIIIGFWAFEPMIFAIWAALGPGRFAIRLPLIVPCLMLVVAAPGLRKASLADTEKYEFITLTTAAMTLLAITSLLLLLVRRSTGWRIEIRETPASGDAVPLQFDIKYLLLLVTLCGIALGLTVSLDFGSPPNQNLFFGRQFVIYILAVGSAVVSLLILPMIAVPLIVLAAQRSASFYWRAIVFWLAVTLGVSGACIAMGSDFPLMLPLQIQLGAAIAGFVAALPLWFAGCRLVARETPPKFKETPGST
jgi:hypothetical protein